MFATYVLQECNKLIDTKDLLKANVPDHICLLCGYQVCNIIMSKIPLTNCIFHNNVLNT